MQDNPTPTELLEALTAFLREEVAPKVEGGLRFKTLVAANVAGIVARELALRPALHRAELARLRQLLGVEEGDGAPTTDQEIAAEVRTLNFDLCRHIEEGDADTGPWRAQVLAHLRQSVAENLTIDNPKHRKEKGPDLSI